jgi:hypothetical protein
VTREPSISPCMQPKHRSPLSTRTIVSANVLTGPCELLPAALFTMDPSN